MTKMRRKVLIAELSKEKSGWQSFSKKMKSVISAYKWRGKPTVYEGPGITGSDWRWTFFD